MSTTMRNATQPRRRLWDRLFVGGCTAAYVVLVLSVAVALRYYGS